MPLTDESVTGALVANKATSVTSSDGCSEPLLDVEQAAEYLNMSPKWVYRNYASLPHVLIGAGKKPRIKFRRCDLDAWVKQHRVV